MYLKIFGIILSSMLLILQLFSPTTLCFCMFLIFVYICVRHIEINRNVLTLDTLVKVCIIKMNLKENV